MRVLGPFTLIPNGVRSIQASPISGRSKKREALAESWRVQHADGWELEVGFLTFDSGEQHVECLDYGEDVPKPLHRLRHGLRMSVARATSGQRFLELSQARIDSYEPPYWSNLKKATEDELDAAAGLSVAAVLKELGLRVGTREDLLGELNNRRGYMCALVHVRNAEAAVVAHVLTRIMPLNHEYEVHGRLA